MEYKTFLEELVDGVVGKDGKRAAPLLKDVVANCTDIDVNFTVVFPKGKLAELEASGVDANGISAVEKFLKLTTTVSTTNMHLFDKDCRLHKYQTVAEIIDAFYEVRMGLYRERKTAIIDGLEKQLVKLSNRAKFIVDNLEGHVDLRRKKALEVETLLLGRGFAKIDGDYTYLTKMHMDSVTEENVAKIVKEKADAEQELATVRGTTLEKMWLGELDVFKKTYAVYKAERATLQKGKGQKATTKTAVKKK